MLVELTEVFHVTIQGYFHSFNFLFGLPNNESTGSHSSFFVFVENDLP